jgi:hypothetical protein
MQTGITLNREQKLYVIPSGSGYTCFGFDNAALHHLQMLTQLVSLSMPSRQPGGEGPTLMDKVFQHPLAWKESDWGQVSGYDKYQKVLSLWSQSAASERTYFDPGTHPEVCRILERARKSGVQLRLFLGDTQTGRDWMEENDVVGRIGRSTGQMKVPLLIPKHDIYGSAILTACVVRIVEATTMRELYRHSKYQTPNLTVAPEDYSPGGYKFRVDRDGELHARFKKVGSAHAYVAFLTGHAINVNTRHLLAPK